MQKTNIVNLIIIIPVKKNWINYYINTTEKIHGCNHDDIRKVISDIDNSYFNPIEFFLERNLPFYINFEKKEINQLFYNNEKELEEIRLQTIKPFDETSIKQIKNSTRYNNIGVIEKTAQLNMIFEILNKKKRN